MFESIPLLFVLPPAHPLSTVVQRRLLADHLDLELREVLVWKVKLSEFVTRGTSYLL